MASCGFCKATDLHHDKSRKDGTGLETHCRPNTTSTCRGAISNGYTGKQSRQARKSAA